MRLSIAAILVTGLAVAGCTTLPEDSGLMSKSQVSGEESNARARARIHTELAAAYYDLGNLGVALEEANEALRADSNYGPAHNVAGLVYSQLKEDRLAEDSFQRALSIESTDPDANNNYGMFLCQRKREQEAIKHFLASVRNPLYPTPDRSYVNAGVCARRGGDVAGAIGYLQLALKVRPNQPAALFQMADIAYARGDYGEARAYLNRLTQITSGTAEVLWLGVRTERRLGDRNAEASYALQLRNKFPDSREARALNAGQYQ